MDTRTLRELQADRNAALGQMIEYQLPGEPLIVAPDGAFRAPPWGELWSDWRWVDG